MKSAIRGLSIILAASCVFGTVSCSSDQEPAHRKITLPAPRPGQRALPLSALGCAQYEFQEDRDNCEKARRAFESKPTPRVKHKEPIALVPPDGIGTQKSSKETEQGSQGDTDAK